MNVAGLEWPFFVKYSHARCLILLFLVPPLYDSDDNIFSYPPGKDTDIYKTCQIFQTSDNPWKDFLFTLLPPSNHSGPPPTCFDMTALLPPDATSLFDTPGDYNDGMMWDFQVCTDLVFILGFSDKSMFPPKQASYEFLFEHCLERFGVTPRPYQLVEKWNFGNLTDHSNILFTNGLQDIWSGGGILHNVSDTVLALTFPNGAHHSELTREGPTDRDTDDIKAGHDQIKAILRLWLDRIH